MGNAQSSETTRRYSQKLSKPKTNSHATAGLLSPNGSSKSAKRLSNAPLPEPPLPPLPPMPMSHSGATTVTASSIAELSGSIEQRAGRSASMSSTLGHPQESKRRGLFRSRTLQGGPDSGRRERNANSTPGIVDRMSRTNSLTYESAIAYYGPPDLDEYVHIARRCVYPDFDSLTGPFVCADGRRNPNLTHRGIITSRHMRPNVC